MNKIVIKHYFNYFAKHGKKIPKYFNPYNECEIKDIAPTLTTNCGQCDSSATVLIMSYEENKKE